MKRNQKQQIPDWYCQCQQQHGCSSPIVASCFVCLTKYHYVTVYSKKVEFAMIMNKYICCMYASADASLCPNLWCKGSLIEGWIRNLNFKASSNDYEPIRVCLETLPNHIQRGNLAFQGKKTKAMWGKLFFLTPIAIPPTRTHTLHYWIYVSIM